MLKQRSRTIIAVLITLTLVSGLMACVSWPVKDPVKTGLYAIKTEWVSIREYVIKEYLDGRMTDQEVQDFRQKDNQFTQIYNLTLLLAQSGTDNEALLSDKLDQLKNLLLEMRRKYYK